MPAPPTPPHRSQLTMRCSGRPAPKWGPLTPATAPPTWRASSVRPSACTACTAACILLPSSHPCHPALVHRAPSIHRAPLPPHTVHLLLLPCFAFSCTTDCTTVCTAACILQRAYCSVHSSHPTSGLGAASMPCTWPPPHALHAPPLPSPQTFSSTLILPISCTGLSFPFATRPEEGA